jgi:hypothetical protein
MRIAGRFARTSHASGLVHLRGLLGNAGRTTGWQLANLPESAPKMTA